MVPTTLNAGALGDHDSASGRGLGDAKQLLGIARRRWLWILASLVVALGLAVAAYVVTPKTYRSTAKISITGRNTELTALNAYSSLEAETLISEDILATHMEIMTSRAVIERAVKNRNLAELPAIQESVNDDTTPAQVIAKQLVVSRGGMGQARTARVLNVQFDSSSAEASQIVVEALVESYQGFIKEKFQDVNRDAVGLIGRARESLAQEVADKELALETHRKNAPSLLWKRGQDGFNSHLLRYEELERERAAVQVLITETTAKLNLFEAKIKDVEQAGGSGFEKLSLIDEKNATRIRALLEVVRGDAQSEEFQSRIPEMTAMAQTEMQTLTNLLVKEKSLRDDYGNGYAPLREVRAQIAAVREVLKDKGKAASKGSAPKKRVDVDPDEVVKGYLSLLRFEADEAKTREAQLTALSKHEEEAARALRDYDAQLDVMRSDVDRQRELYQVVVDRLREINLQQDLGGFANEVIEEPALGEKVAPKLLVFLVIGGLGGMLTGFSLAGIAELRDHHFRGPRQIEESLGAPVVAHVPALAMSRAEATSPVMRNLRESQPGLDTKLLSYFSPRSTAAEVFRSIRTQLLFNTEMRNLRVVQFASTMREEGTSVCLANVAISLAHAGRKVLIIDCDLHDGNQSELLGVDGGVGLANVLCGEETCEDAIVATGVRNLALLPHGRSAYRAVELLSQESFAGIIEYARERFDFVLLDSPPTLAAHDACVISRHTDGVVFVVRPAIVTPESARNALASIEHVGSRTIGIVVNHFDRGSSYVADDGRLMSAYPSSAFANEESVELPLRSPAR
jgi:succinoglycan biosynthesis transport protein ExoP